MSDDLIKRLREADSYNKKYYALDPLHNEAADRIEQLERERDEARHLQSCACNYDTPTDVCMGHHALFERLYAAERGKLEAKLAKAAEALREIVSNQGYMDDPWGHAAAALTELEGKE